MATIAVIGAGAVGGYYGARLAQHGHDVRFLMRKDLAAVREHGLRVFSRDGDFQLPTVSAFRSPEEIGPVDWVICSLKATAIEDAQRLVTPCVGPQTRIVALMNGLGIEERFAAWCDPARVFGGMAFVCINRGEPGVIHHLDYGRISIGHFRDDPRETAVLRDLLGSGAIDVAVAPNLRYARWEKLCWNVPFNGLSVAGGGIGTQTIVTDAELRATAERTMREVIAAGNADLEALGSAARLDAAEIVPRMFALTGTMGDYRTSMVIDYVLGRELEVEAILGNPVRRARELGMETPTMAALYALVRHAGRVRRGLQPVLTPDVLDRPTQVV
ncbi:MAG: 2-dehydropantoate 2-reductase [Dehalococcoidia bacterium]|nr:2-dehydropantoate 2-reductase [Dehalococcoidia bacterium]